MSRTPIYKNRTYKEIVTINIERRTDNFDKIALDRDFKNAGLVGDLNDIETNNQIKGKTAQKKIENQKDTR